MIRKASFILLALLLGTIAYFTYNIKFIRTGTIVEIRKDAIVVRGSGQHDPDYVFPVEEKSRFYDKDGNEISLSELKVGDHVKVKLFPRSYGGRGISVIVRKQKTVRWIKIL